MRQCHTARKVDVSIAERLLEIWCPDYGQQQGWARTTFDPRRCLCLWQARIRAAFGRGRYAPEGRELVSCGGESPEKFESRPVVVARARRAATGDDLLSLAHDVLP